MSRRHHRRGLRLAFSLLPTMFLLLFGFVLAAPAAVSGAARGGVAVATVADHPSLPCHEDCAGGGWLCADLGPCSMVILPIAQQASGNILGMLAATPEQRRPKPHPPAVLLRPPTVDRV